MRYSAAIGQDEFSPAHFVLSLLRTRPTCKFIRKDNCGHAGSSPVLATKIHSDIALFCQNCQNGSFRVTKPTHKVAVQLRAWTGVTRVTSAPLIVCVLQFGEHYVWKRFYFDIKPERQQTSHLSAKKKHSSFFPPFPRTERQSKANYNEQHATIELERVFFSFFRSFFFNAELKLIINAMATDSASRLSRTSVNVSQAVTTQRPNISDLLQAQPETLVFTRAKQRGTCLFSKIENIF